jgi:DNA-binding HxlR family transcriptional regulator
MANVFARISKNSKIIQLCEKPMRFTDLKKEVEISDAGLNKNLKALQKVGWIRRRLKEGGTYELTLAGRRVLPQAQRAETLSLDFKTAPKLLDNVVIHHIGLEDDGESLLREIAQAIEHYIPNKYSDETLTLIIQYKPYRDT